MSSTTIRRTLTPYIAPKGKKFNQPCSMGVPTVSVQLECPVCSKYNKNGEIVEFHPKESASAPMCKKCHEKALANKIV